MDPATALQTLLDGHTRHITERPAHPHQTHDRRTEVAAGPRPIAAILGCADARVPPEVLFDQGIGDLFVVRVAGAAVTDLVLGSLAVAVAEMGVPLIVVLGHTRCRAVQLAVETLYGEGEATEHLNAVVEALLPAVAGVANQPGDRVGAATRAAVSLAVARLRAAEPVLAPRVHEGTLEVAGWLYDVDSGIVEMLV